MQLDLFKQFLHDNRIEFKINEPMKAHTSFKIGGNADVFITVCSAKQLQSVIKAANEYAVNWFIIGKGSNLLVSDDGIDGAVISLSGIDSINTCGGLMECGAGAALSTVCRAALNNSLTGLEFAYGIPGSVGGGLFMNAGAYGGDMSQVVSSAQYVTENGDIGTLGVSEMNLGYRQSAFKDSSKIITNVTFKLEKGIKSDIEQRMNELINKRKSKQPLEYPSAGSTFKRPTGYFAGALIEQSGLKGMSVGGSMVSEKHAGFVINYQNASCEDVRNLIEKIKEEVFKNTSVVLEPEVIYKGRKKQ